jgi:hypothetical protein
MPPQKRGIGPYIHSDVSCPSPRDDLIGMLRLYGVMPQLSRHMTKIRTRAFVEEAGISKQAEVVQLPAIRCGARDGGAQSGEGDEQVFMNGDS